MRTKKREFKLVPQFIKGIDGRTVDGVFSVAGIVDSYGDIVEKGSFAKTIAERSGSILHLWQHDFYSPPTAVIEKLREIERSELPEIVQVKFPDATGGAMVSRTYIESPRADEVLIAIKAGSPLQMSYGYDAIRYEFEELEDGNVIRHLIEQRLWETSDVLWGANEATSASKQKPSIPLDTLLGQLDQWLRQVKAGRRNAEKDIERINKIATLAIDLGADAVILTPAEEDDEDGKTAVNELIELASAAGTDADETDEETETETIVVTVEETQTDEETQTEINVEPEASDEANNEETADGSIEDDDAEKERRSAGSIPPITLLFARLDLLEIEV